MKWRSGSEYPRIACGVPRGWTAGEGMTGRHSGNDKQKTTLLVGFDSAWTASNSGGLAGVLRSDDGNVRELGLPLIVDYPQAQEVISKWQDELAPTATIVLLDQPTIVPNPRGQRPVENIAGSVVSRRYEGERGQHGAIFRRS